MFTLAVIFCLSAPIGGWAADPTPSPEKPEKQKVWKVRNKKGVIARIDRDTNDDGKPDSYSLLISGRQVILREDDTNFDGKIDSRRLTEWGEIKSGPGLPSIPAYRNTWREQDTDFDGKIDVYVERGNKEIPPGKIGSAMNTAVSPVVEDEPAKPVSHGESLVNDRNERYGLNK